MSAVRPSVYIVPSQKPSSWYMLFKPEESKVAGQGNLKPGTRFRIPDSGFLVLGLPSPAWWFESGVKTVENKALQNRWPYHHYGRPLSELYSNTNPNWPEIVALSNFPSIMWTGSETHSINPIRLQYLRCFSGCFRLSRKLTFQDPNCLHFHQCWRFVMLG